MNTRSRRLVLLMVLLCSAILFFSTTVFAANQEWVAVYPAAGTTEAVLVDSQDHIHAVGSAPDGVRIINYDTAGNQGWVKSLPGKWLYATRSVVLDTRDNIIVCSGDGSVIKLDAAGNVVWETSLAGSLPGSSVALLAVTVDARNQIYAVGYAVNASGAKDAVLAKLGSGGTLAWVKTYDGGADDAANAVRIDALGNVFVTGDSSGSMALWSYDKNGKIRFMKVDGNAYPMEYVPVNDLGLDPLENIVVAWLDNLAGNLNINKYDPTGNLIWNVSRQMAQPRSLRIDSAGNIYVAGSQASGSWGGYLLAKYDPAGSVLWDRVFIPYGDSMVYALELDKQENPVITGEYGYSPNYLRSMKYSPDAGLIWWFNYSPYIITGSWNFGKAIGFDSMNNAYIGGYSLNQPILIKYAN